MFIKLVTKYFRVALLGVIIILSPIFISAQLSYTIERINTEKGLPTNAIKGLQFDSKNRFLWVATESGIVRYNGHGFQNFGDETKNEKLNGRIVFFEKAEDGTLFGKLMDESIFKIENNKAFIDDKIPKISWQHQFIAFKYNLPPIKLKGITSLTDYFDFKLDNKIYFITDNRIKRFENSKLDTLVTFKNGEQGFKLNQRWFLINSKGTIQEVKHDKNFNLLITDFNKNVFELSSKNENKGNIKVFQNHPSEPVFLIRDNKLFQLVWVNQQIIPRLITDKIPFNEIIRYVQMDMITKTIYLGTDNRGLLVANPQYFKRLLPFNEIKGASTSSYAQLLLKNGNIQINSGQLFGNNTLTKPNIFYKFSSPSTFITKDSLLFFTNEDGLIEYDFKKNTIYKKHKIFTQSNSYIEFDDQLLYFNKIGVFKRDENEVWNQINFFKELPYDFMVYDTKKISDSDLLVATTRGLFKYNYKRNIFKLFFNEKNNLIFRSIYKLNNYYLLGTYGNGVYMFYNDSLKKVPLDQNKYLSYAHCFIEDNKGNVWASTNKGLFRSPGQSLIDFWNKGPGNIKFRYFGKLEGIDELEFNGGCSPCAIKLNNGYLSFPGIDGLIQFNPESIPDFNIEPKVFLDKLKIDGNFVNLDFLKDDLSPKIKNLELQLAISGMLSEDNIFLEYKLDDDPWIRVNVKNNNITYNNPGYGTHNFSIRLRNTIYSKWEQNDYPFNVKYPLILHPIMFLIYFFILIGLVFLYTRFKTIIYKRRQKSLEKEVYEKTKSLNSLNDFLQRRNQAKDHVIAIMNHDVLTPLKYLHITARNTAEQINDTQLKTSIDQIAKTSKELEYLTSNMLNWVKFENFNALPNQQNIDLFQFVQGLIEFVSPFKLNETIKIQNQIPIDISITNWPDALKVVLYNLLVNAIKSTYQGEINILFKQSSKHYEIVIQDTGEGMSESMIYFLINGNSEDQVESLPKYKKGNGIGYQIIRHLVKIMKADLNITSKENQGTEVSLKFKNLN